ncbi:MAG: hypothetical protein H0V62_09615 [Gammaproteobacteria bacterium]|nr:hypothetical protein [Gammaproteobacteria bacterium]
MNHADRQPALSLLLLRLSVFLVMVMWTLDKFVRPAHAAGVYGEFYSLGGLSHELFYVVAALELAVIIGFVLGFKKRITYGAVLLFHAVSTLSSYRQYFAPFEDVNLLFFAAWPMLAACFALYSLRDRDTLLAWDK